MRATIAHIALLLTLLAAPALPTQAAPRPTASSPVVNPMGWQDQLVDKLGSVGQGSSMTLDSLGHPHIAYYDFTQHGLKYAAWDGVAWTLDTVERDLGPIDGNSQVFPLRSGIGFYGGTAYIVYQKFDAQTGARYLRYALGGPGGWTLSTIGSADAHTFAYAPALRLDPNHSLHLSYTLRDPLLQFPPDQVIYARLDVTSTNWLLQPVAGPLCCYHSIVTSLALGPGNNPQIAYGDNGNLSQPAPLWLARWNTGAWLTQTTPITGSMPSLAVDQAGSPRLAYVSQATFPFTKLGYATLTSTTWLTQTPSLCDCRTAPSLALDALDRPHIAIDNAGLQVLAWDGAAWQTADLAQAAPGAAEPMLALDLGGNAQVSYIDNQYQDLHHMAWGPTWITQTVALAGSQPSLAVDQHAIPYISYQDSHLELAHWAGADEWQYQTVAPSGNDNSLQLQYGADQTPLPIIAYQDSALQFDAAAWTGAAFVTQTVDGGNNVGYDLSLALNGSQPAVAYFERNYYKLEYAEETSPSVWTIRNDTAQPQSNYLSGAHALSLGVAPNCCRSYIAYYDGVGQILRLARWDGASWTDQVVDAKGNTGVRVSLAVDRASGEPAMAYYDATHHTLKYAVWRGQWISDTVDNLLQDVSGVSLQLGLGSDEYPRIAYTVKADNSLRLAWTAGLTGTWTIDTVAAFTGNPPPEVTSRVQQRDHLAFTDPSGGIGYAFRAATLPYNLDYNPLQPCVDTPPAAARSGQMLAQVQARLKAQGPAAAAQLDDLDTLRALRDLFALSAGGQYYINLYYQFGPETGALAVADPALAWDGYRTLQNFLPGAQALIAGQGGQVTLTQSMVDQANNILDRLSAAGSPALQSAIAAERAKYHHLQDFTGQTFAQAASLIGLTGYHLFLPLVTKP